MGEDLSGEFIGKATYEVCVDTICSGVCDFALVRIFGISQTPSLVSIPKILTNTKQAKRGFFIQSTTASTSIVFLCDYVNRGIKCESFV